MINGSKTFPLAMQVASTDIFSLTAPHVSWFTPRSNDFTLPGICRKTRLITVPYLCCSKIVRLHYFLNSIKKVINYKRVFCCSYASDPYHVGFFCFKLLRLKKFINHSFPGLFSLNDAFSLCNVT